MGITKARRTTMARTSYRRRVTGKTSDDKPISIGRVSSNGCAAVNARAKGCFGNPKPKHYTAAEMKKLNKKKTVKKNTKSKNTNNAGIAQ